MKYLVLSNATLEGEEVYGLLDAARAAGRVQKVHIVVPVKLQEEDPFEVAKGRLNKAIDRMSGMGLEVTGELGDDDPYLALKDALNDDAYDRILIPTLKKGLSRWVRMDLLSRATRLTDTPVEKVDTQVG